MLKKRQNKFNFLIIIFTLILIMLIPSIISIYSIFIKSVEKIKNLSEVQEFDLYQNMDDNNIRTISLNFDNLSRSLNIMSDNTDDKNLYFTGIFNNKLEKISAAVNKNSDKENQLDIIYKRKHLFPHIQINNYWQLFDNINRGFFNDNYEAILYQEALNNDLSNTVDSFNQNTAEKNMFHNNTDINLVLPEKEYDFIFSNLPVYDNLYRLNSIIIPAKLIHKNLTINDIRLNNFFFAGDVKKEITITQNFSNYSDNKFLLGKKMFIELPESIDSFNNIIYNINCDKNYSVNLINEYSFNNLKNLQLTFENKNDLKIDSFVFPDNTVILNCRNLYLNPKKIPSNLNVTIVNDNEERTIFNTKGVDKKLIIYCNKFIAQETDTQKNNND